MVCQAGTVQDKLSHSHGCYQSKSHSCEGDYFFHCYSAEQMEKPKSGESAIKIVGNELLTLNMLTTQKKCLFLHLYFSDLKENL